MKLSKQERIAVLVIAVVIILGLGIFLFIVPKFQAIGTDSAALTAKQAEYQAAIDRANTKQQLGEDVINAYNDGRNIADMFFEEMTPYEADNEIRAFIQYCKDNDVNISVDSLAIGSPSVSSLSVSFFDEPEVTYDLKTAAQGTAVSQEKADEAARQALLQAALSSSQTVGSIDVTFTVTTLNSEDMMKFIDIANNYQKQEDGGRVRKALKLSSGLSLEFVDVQEEYAKLMEDMAVDVAFDAAKQLASDTGTKAPTKAEVKNDQAEQAAAAAAEAGQDAAAADETDNKDGESIEDNTKQLTVTLTMYSLARMQDPTEELAAQNAQ